MKKILLNNSGFSIIEVLIGAVVFMLGFTTMVLMLNNVFIKFSTKEYISAQQLANTYMLQATTQNDLNFTDTTIERSDIQFRVIKAVDINDNLAAIRIGVYRLKTNKEIITLYNEVYLVK